MIFQAAFKIYEVFPNQLDFGVSIAGLKEKIQPDKVYTTLEALCLKYGLSKLWISDDKWYMAKGENINFRSGSEEAVECYKKLFKAVGLDVNTLMKPEQKHTANIKCLDRIVEKDKLLVTDGLITDKKGITLTTTNADCILILFYDPVKKVIANVHSGWKGTFKKIAEKTVIKMIPDFFIKDSPHSDYKYI